MIDMLPPRYESTRAAEEVRIRNLHKAPTIIDWYFYEKGGYFYPWMLPRILPVRYHHIGRIHNCQKVHSFPVVAGAVVDVHLSALAFSAALEYA